MVVVDSSAWIEFLRGTGSAADASVQQLIADDQVVICDAIVMELLAGARDAANLADLKRLLARAQMLPTTSAHYEHAATLYRTCRRNGETVRKMLDCLIAGVAVTAGIPVLHADSDFDALARHSSLRIYH